VQPASESPAIPAGWVPIAIGMQFHPFVFWDLKSQIIFTNLRLGVVNTVVLGLGGAASCRHANPALHFWKSILLLSVLKNTPITGFFVCQRKGKFDIGVFSTILGKACYMDAFPL
jgi:hypothetical protein